MDSPYITTVHPEQQQEPIMGQAVAPAPAGNEVHYERRRPEETTLYQVVQEHLESFLAQVEAETGSSLPEFIKDEFDAFLECGILAHGFLRLRCARVARMRSWWPFRVSLPRKGGRVGLRIVLFEACSAFTRVTACTLALSPYL